MKVQRELRDFECLKSKFPQVDKDVLTLISRMLAFNPSKRLTASQCLESPIFDGIRIPTFERMHASFKINLKFESDNVLSVNDLKRLLKQTVIECR